MRTPPPHTLSLSTVWSVHTAHTYFCAMSNDKSVASAPAHMHMLYICMHMHMHMCMQHAHGHVHAHAYTVGYIFLFLRERTRDDTVDVEGEVSQRIERFTHTHPGVWRDIGHGTLRCEVQVSDIVPDILISFSYAPAHRSKPRASRPPHTPNRYPASNFFVSSNPRRSDTWTCLLQRAHITWRARTPHSTSLGLAFWCDGAGPHPPTFRPHARDGHPARPTPHDVCELT